MVKKLKKIEGTGIPLRGDDIDTDRIVPGRFLKEVTFDNMGDYVFYDARRNDEGELNEHPFNIYSGNILVVNKNFGCGSSREHAPQALMRWGIDAILGESFAEIFEDNSISIGIPVAVVDEKDIKKIQDMIEEYPDIKIELDIKQENVQVGNETFEVDVAAKESLLKGKWDTTTLMKTSMDRVKDLEESLPYPF